MLFNVQIFAAKTFTNSKFSRTAKLRKQKIRKMFLSASVSCSKEYRISSQHQNSCVVDDEKEPKSPPGKILQLYDIFSYPKLNQCSLLLTL